MIESEEDKAAEINLADNSSLHVNQFINLGEFLRINSNAAPRDSLVLSPKPQSKG
jgi:hypothetical protein